jgi:1-deoxy-D-xylulose-5-phosphate synthase
MLRAGTDVALLALGSMVRPSLEAARLLAEVGRSAAVYNMLWVKPLDAELIRALDQPLIVTLEEGTLIGGFGSAVLEALSDGNSPALSPVQRGLSASRPAQQVLRFGIPDEFVHHGSPAELLADYGLDSASIAIRISETLISMQGEVSAAKTGGPAAVTPQRPGRSLVARIRNAFGENQT